MAESISQWTTAEVMDDARALERVPGQAVVTGADAVTPTGVVNKVKTRALVEAARKDGVPSYVVANAIKYVPHEVPIVPPFEKVPMDLLTGIADGAQLLSPAEAGGTYQLHLHPRVRSLLGDLMREARP